MKKPASLIYRIMVAFLLAGLVALAQYSIWAYMNRGTEFISSNLSIKGFAYAGFQRNQSPLHQTYPSAEEVDRDLTLLARSTDSIRIYSAAEIPSILKLAGKHDLLLTTGAWISANLEKNEQELDAAIEAAKNLRYVERLIIGNEVILRTEFRQTEQTEQEAKQETVKTLITYLERARAAQRKPVSTAETWDNWLAYPELADHVDFITVHLLPYHEKQPVEYAVEYALKRYDELAARFPKKKIVIGEIGWPSRGPTKGEAIASINNEARFIREFLAHPRSPRLDYFLMEAFDQPWKIEAEEGWEGGYWGMYNADREPKFSLEGLVERDPHWSKKASNAAVLAFLPMFLIAFFLRRWNFFGRLFLAALIQACISTLVIGLNIPLDYYLSQRDLIGLVILIVATSMTAAVLLSHGFEFGELLFKRRWRRRFSPQPPLPSEKEPFVSIHLACYNEPPEMVIATLDSLAQLHYQHFEVLVLDNNTTDEALWKPLEARCAELGSRFRFFHLENWPGFKAGALNYGLKVTDSRAQIIGVVDADYVVSPDWLACLIPHFTKENVAVVQAPQAHRDWEHHFFQRMCNWEFDGFFRIGMHHRNERNALIQHGTMTLVRKSALEEVGGWSEWCICEDTELGLRLIERGYDTRYVDHILGRGLTPSDFAAIKTQRFRWAFGAMQILKNHLPAILGHSQLTLAQRYHFLTGWFSWLGDALQLVFALGSLIWTLGILLLPKSFGLPVPTLAIPILGFMIFKAALGPILYRQTMNCPWKDILGASLLSVGLAHTIARGVFAGLIKKKGKFVRTPKGWKAKGTFAFFNPIREEITLLFALILAAGSLIVRGIDDLESWLWISILGLQCIPYVAAIGCQIAAYMPESPKLHTEGKQETVAHKEAYERHSS